MHVAAIEAIPVSTPYQHPERSSRVDRDGVSAVGLRVESDDGRTGWGECSVGPLAETVLAAVRAMTPLVVGRSPWETAAIAHDVFHGALWDLLPMVGNFAFADIDMAPWDLCGQDADQPLCNLFGGRQRQAVDYFCYLKQGSVTDVEAQCRRGLAMGCTVFYLKLGLDLTRELQLVAAIRDTIGPAGKLRIDANCAWSANEAVRNLARRSRNQAVAWRGGRATSRRWPGDMALPRFGGQAKLGGERVPTRRAREGDYQAARPHGGAGWTRSSWPGRAATRCRS